MQQQTLPITHTCMLDGGVGVRVCASLTYRVCDVSVMMRAVCAHTLTHTLTQCSQAEIACVMATVYMERMNDVRDDQHIDDDDIYTHTRTHSGGYVASQLSERVMTKLTPMFREWGVAIIVLQIGNITLENSGFQRQVRVGWVGKGWVCVCVCVCVCECV